MAYRFRLAAVAALTLALTSGCGVLGGNNTASPQTVPTTDQAPVKLAATPDSPLTEPTTASPSPSKSKAAVKKTKKPSPKASTPTVDPNNFQAASCFHYEGKAVSKSTVKAALNAAAAKRYWPTSAPSLVVPAGLVRAVAWNESGWQSNVVNCDGGYGLMQLMPATTDFVNSRFTQSYDPKAYKQNAIIGANDLAWLTKYIGDNYFGGSYSLSTSKCKTSSSWCLLNAVIAGYHYGAGAIESAASSKKLPGGDNYVYVVRSLMRSCFCDRY
jgi:hypothetical protein